MTAAGESSEPTRAGEAVPPLRGLLELSRLIRRHPTLPETLRAVCATVSEALGFATTVVSVYRPETDDYETVAVHGPEPVRARLLGRVTAAGAWAPLLDARFRRHGVYFVPAGAADYDQALRWHGPAPSRPVPLDEGSWRADDALLAALDGSAGHRYGIISVDDPVSGRRPGDEVLEVFGALASHAALALDNSRQMAALEDALAHHRAVITSALDSVIAVDAHDRVVEFNPAAERTFRYGREEVLGRGAAELFVPPDIRDSYRRNAERLRASARARLLDRRIETSAQRRDGEVFPVELTITRVEGADGEAPIFYAVIRDISERRRGEEQLAYLAYHDSLTGLPNRHMVEQQLDLALARARRAEGSAALMFVDLDDFKDVNDRLGHAAGDRLLASVAARLRGVLRGSDILARQGGDEFLVLIADLAEDAAPAAENVAVKLLEALREPFVVAGTEVRTTASIGISLYPVDASDTEALMRHADAAMYQAKAAGGGRLSFHQPSGTLQSRRASVSAQLRAAMTHGELELHYQPVWRLGEGGGMLGVEALLRWHHPERGLLGPDAFMNLADQTSAGDDLTDWVIGEACRQARAWRNEGLEPLLGLNVSPHQLLAPGFVGRWHRHLDRAGLSAAGFVIELTESAWTVDSADALAVIGDLRAAGATLALDDFGAGYSSLSRLLELGFDVIKVDGRLLRDVPGDPTAVRLLEAVFDLIAACRADVIAEGVETDAQVDFLTGHGITYAQGFGLGRPVPAVQATAALRQSLASGPPPRRRGTNPGAPGAC
ncbi:MAG TPA: EAL domain-containing protein [Solirubrobacteraceae bacterium]|nr:EAL domain-containing protein [Solirubrobacteraceae bacterium]